MRPHDLVCTCGERVETTKLTEHLNLWLCDDPRFEVDSNRVHATGHRAPATTLAATQRAQLRAGTQRQRVYDLVKTSADGMTDDELELVTGKAHQSVSATRNSLMNDGWLVDSGRRRRTRYGNDAIVWVSA